MSITIVMAEGKTLYVQDATPEQVKHLRAILAAGRGMFEFSLNSQLYMVNCANVLYAEMTPAAASL